FLSNGGRRSPPLPSPRIRPRMPASWRRHQSGRWTWESSLLEGNRRRHLLNHVIGDRPIEVQEHLSGPPLQLRDGSWRSIGDLSLNSKGGGSIHIRLELQAV